MAGWNSLSTGGQLKPDSLTLIGQQVQNMISNYHVDKAIISCKGIDPVAGITDSGESQALAKQAMMRAAKQTILCLDSSKFDKISFVNIAPLQSVQAVVTNTTPNGEWMNFFRQNHLPCHYPG